MHGIIVLSCSAVDPGVSQSHARMWKMETNTRVWAEEAEAGIHSTHESYTTVVVLGRANGEDDPDGFEDKGPELHPFKQACMLSLFPPPRV